MPNWREVHRQPAFDPYRGRELLPGDEVRTTDELDAFIRETATTNFHASGTCAMSSNASAVLDCDCRVRGVDALRVVDASVMPQLISGNPNGPTIMIAEKVADAMKGKKEPAQPSDYYVAHDWQHQQRPNTPAR